jgi:hypothetical protein
MQKATVISKIINSIIYLALQFNAIPERSLPLIEVGDEFRQKLD